jgi:hypothetical protein
VSTGRFEHPLSRRDVRRDECVSLDAYLKEHGLPHLRVCYAFDHRDEFAPDGSGNTVTALREEATRIMQSLFSASSANAAAARARVGGRAAGGRAAGGAGASGRGGGCGLGMGRGGRTGSGAASGVAPCGAAASTAEGGNAASGGAAGRGFGFAGRGRGRRLNAEPPVVDYYDSYTMDETPPGAAAGGGGRLFEEPAVTDHYDGFTMIDDDALPGAASGVTSYEPAPPAAPPACGRGGSAGACSRDGGSSVQSASAGAGGGGEAGGTRGAPAVNGYVNSHEASLYLPAGRAMNSHEESLYPNRSTAMNSHEASLYAPAGMFAPRFPPRPPPEPPPSFPALEDSRAAASRQVAAAWSRRRGGRDVPATSGVGGTAPPTAVVASGPVYSESAFAPVSRRFRPDACVMSGAGATRTAAQAAPSFPGARIDPSWSGNGGSMARSGVGNGYEETSGMAGAAGGGVSGGISRAPVRQPPNNKKVFSRPLSFHTWHPCHPPSRNRTAPPPFQRPDDPLSAPPCYTPALPSPAAATNKTALARPPTS